MGENEPRRILVAEDDPPIRSFYVMLLKKEGHMVDTAADGEEAMTKVSSGGYDLVLLDVMMPKMSGMDILKKFQEVPPVNPPKKIVILTNLDQDITIAQGLNYGIDGYMIKSDFTPPNFIKEVGNFLTN